jgi:proprotein convertase subtilisin/kexin type 1
MPFSTLYLRAYNFSPLLTWRDVQHLLAWTCQVAPLQDNPIGTWMKNGAGFHVSHDFGFGMLNINDLVEKAKEFRNVGAMNSCVTRANLNK